MISPTWRELKLWTAIMPEEAQRLRELAAGKHVLEIGAAYGYSAIIMALAGANSVLSVDSHSGDTWLGDTWSAMKANLEAFAVSSRVTMLRGLSNDVMPELVKGFDFIFLDGGETYDQNMSDLEHAIQLVALGGTIARHDYGHKDYPDNKIALDQLFPCGPTRLTNSLFEVKFP